MLLSFDLKFLWFIFHWEFPSKDHSSSYIQFFLFSFSFILQNLTAENSAVKPNMVLPSAKFLLSQQAHIPIHTTQISPRYQAVLNCQSRKSSSVFTSISCKIVIAIVTVATANPVIEDWYMGVHFCFPSYLINQINHSKSYCVIYFSSQKG